MSKKKSVKKIKKQISKKAVVKSEKRVWWPYLLLFALSFILFGNTLNHSWTLDDYSAIKDNYLTKQGVEAIPELMTTSYRHGYWSSKGHHYRPGPLVMFALEWEISPDNPNIHHFVNVLSMAILAMLIYYFLLLISGSQVWSLIIAILYLAHPLHVEVVANIKSRDEIMAMMLMLLSLVGWWRFNVKKSWLVLTFSLVFFGLALLFKENAITLIGLILLTSFLFFWKQNKSHGPFAFLYLLPAFLYLSARSSVLKLGNLEGGLSNTSPLDNLLFAIENKADQKTLD